MEVSKMLPFSYKNMTRIFPAEDGKFTYTQIRDEQYIANPT